MTAIAAVALVATAYQNGDARIPSGPLTLVGPGVISTSDNERGITFTPDGDTAYFTRALPEPYFSVILVSARARGTWTAPRVADFSGKFVDSDPAVAPDGQSLVFSSTRPIDRASSAPLAKPDLWIVRRTMDGRWGAPEHLPEPINSPGTDAGAAFGPDGALYFHSGRLGGMGSMDLYVARKEGDHFAAPIPLGEPNSDAWEGYPSISPDGTLLVFTSIGRQDEMIGAGAGYARGDLYVSRWEHGKWGPGHHLPAPFNSAAAECCTRFSPDGRTFYITSERGFATEPRAGAMTVNTMTAGLRSIQNGLGNIYAMPIEALMRSVGEPIADSTVVVPEMFAPGIVSTEFNEFGGAFTPDGDTVYFARSVPRSYAYAILWSHRVGSGWSAPEVAPFSGTWRDFDLIVPPDNKHRYFVSDRPIGGKRQTGYQFWVMDRTRNGWSSPHPLGAPFDQFGSVWFLSETRNGTIYFNVQPPDGPARIYTTRRTATGFTTPQLLPESVNLPGVAVREPYVAPDDSFLIFDSGPGDVTTYDLYISYHRGDSWSPARKLDALNSPTRDYSPRITVDGKWLYFTSERSFADSPLVRPLTADEYKRALHGPLNGLGNIYRVPIAAVHAAAAAADRADAKRSP